MAALYLIEILHQTTTPALASMPLCRCILLKFYIKPQLRLERELAYCVVSYRNSTSNHNEPFASECFCKLYLIEILHQTTTILPSLPHNLRLYLIEILHQTTTFLFLILWRLWLYLIEILHQTTTSQGNKWWTRCCILSKFYIKPQRARSFVSLTNGCILSKFYIKPQPHARLFEHTFVVSY